MLLNTDLDLSSRLVRLNLAGATTPGTFFSFITALLLAYQPVKSLANLNASLQEGLAAAARVFALIEAEPTIRDRPGARPLRVARGEVVLEDVHFAYAPGKAALISMTQNRSRARALNRVSITHDGVFAVSRLLVTGPPVASTAAVRSFAVVFPVLPVTPTTVTCRSRARRTRRA